MTRFAVGVCVVICGCASQLASPPIGPQDAQIKAMGDVINRQEAVASQLKTVLSGQESAVVRIEAAAKIQEASAVKVEGTLKAQDISAAKIDAKIDKLANDMKIATSQSAGGDAKSSGSHQIGLINLSAGDIAYPAAAVAAATAGLGFYKARRNRQAVRSLVKSIEKGTDDIRTKISEFKRNGGKDVQLPITGEEIKQAAREIPVADRTFGIVAVEVAKMLPRTKK